MMPSSQVAVQDATTVTPAAVDMSLGPAEQPQPTANVAGPEIAFGPPTQHTATLEEVGQLSFTIGTMVIAAV